jgi:hypothetical protein
MLKDMGDESVQEPNSNYDDTYDDNYRIFESYDGLEDCKLNTYSRVRYFEGQLLVPEDFTHDQNYFNSKRHLINKLITGTGVVCGLDLQIMDQSAEHLLIRIGSGLAIDCCGREIIVENSKDISLKISQRLFSKTVKRLGLFLIRSEFLKSPTPLNTTDYPSRPQLSESRIQETYKLILKSIGTNPAKIEFDKTSYDIGDKVKVELWDPDNLTVNEKDGKQRKGENGDTVKVNISSNRDRAEISLHKLKKVDIYQGEIDLTTKNGRSAHNKLAVSDSDIIQVKYNNDIFATAFVTHSIDSFMLNEKKIMANYYNKKLLKCYQEQNPTHKALNFNNQEHGILLAILKGKSDKEDKQVLLIDQLETDMYKEVVYNNPLLYDFVGQNNGRHEVEKQSTRCAVLSDIYKISADTIQSLKINNSCLITDPINIFENNPLYLNKFLEFPPIIHLGRITYQNPDKVMGFENFDYAILSGLYKSVKDGNILAKEMNLDLMESISCKPLAVTNDSFRLVITKKSDKGITSATELVLRWWAVCQFKE